MSRRLLLKIVMAVPLLMAAFMLFMVRTAMANDTTVFDVTPDYRITAGNESTAGLMLVNDDMAVHTYELKVSGLSDGLSGYFTSDAGSADQLKINSGDSAEIQFHLQVPGDYAKDGTDATVEILRDDGMSRFIKLHFGMQSSYSAKLTCAVKKVHAESGRSFTVDIAVTNTGSSELDSVSLNTALHGKWILDGITPAAVTLKPGESSTYSVSVSIPVSQSSGTYIIKAAPFNKDMSGSEISIPVQVSSNPYLVWILAAAVLAVSAAAAVYFRNHVRR